MALIEAAAAVLVAAFFVGGVLLGAYLWFARAWIEYQSEQALYCVAEARPAPHCRRRLHERLNGFLPYRDSLQTTLQSGRENWKLRLEWKWNGYRIHLEKELSTRRMQKAAVSL